MIPGTLPRTLPVTAATFTNLTRANPDTPLVFDGAWSITVGGCRFVVALGERVVAS